MAPRALLLISIGAMCVACTQHSSVRNMHKVTVRASRGVTYVNDTIFSGTLVSFYPQSTDTLEVQTYRKGREHGAWKKFHPGGKSAETRYYIEGKKTGVLTSWYHNGQMKAEYHFTNNEFNGNSRDWNVNGILIRNMNYEKGYEKGLQQLWDDDGTLRANYVAKNGRNYGLTGVKGCATIWKRDSVHVR